MNGVRRTLGSIALIGLTACQNGGPDRPSPNNAASPPPPTAVATTGPAPIAPPPAASGTATLPDASTAPPPPTTPLPPLASVKVLRLRSRQGGPSHPKCGGVISELEIDLVKQRWTRGLCMDKSKQASPNPDQPLDKRSGALTAAHRALIESEYAKLVAKAGPNCGADFGRTDLTLLTAGGATVAFVNAGTSCGPNPPDVADDLDEFQSRVFAITR